MKYDYQLRDSQKKCIEFSKDYIRENGGKGELLWNCKMRFGKCFTALSFALESGYKNVLVMTHMPAVMNEWKSLVVDHKNFEGWKFYNYKDDEKKLVADKDEKRVVFCSNQLYYTRKRRKELLIDKIEWDLLIIDEMHIAFDEEGEPSKFVTYAASFKGKKGRDAVKKINKKVLLNLTGTPLNAINNGMYDKNQIYTYSYIDEMRNAEVSDAVRMKMRLVDLPAQYNKPCQGFNCMGEDSGSPLSYLNPFLRNKKTGEYDQIYNTNDDVVEFLCYLQGKVEHFKHSIWVLETEQSCLFVKKLIREHHLFKGWELKIVAGDTESAGGEFLKRDIESFVSQYEKTICMTVHKGLTGITIPQWDSVIWLSETASPKKYFQACFRAQSSGEGKTYATVMDFNPLRAVRMIDGYLNTFQNIPLGKRASEFLSEFYVYDDAEGERITLSQYYEMLAIANSKTKGYPLGSYNDLRHGEELYSRFLRDFDRLYAIAKRIRSNGECSNLPKKVSIGTNDYDALMSYKSDVKLNFDKICNNSLVLYVKERFCALIAALPDFLESEGVENFVSFSVIKMFADDFKRRFGISYDSFTFMMNFGLVADERVFAKVKGCMSMFGGYRMAV